ncbi:NAD(P)/FAD-dependent oxidoreductase [Fulvivirga sediminis]|uniref:NADH:ubiquinone reductase (non-electrogenic) n=1 Tax=Fulvivirga sediminis TaxID=2803949 RepID=A0A937FBD8_9BACT|nr:NAD(P)/FAD-dependent oxidoreductase [Fulvivirga sediminis]MBL3657765.1 NAD(P)/FAD-dependent oxidoreductase [Fulvivirga sediminis]
MNEVREKKIPIPASDHPRLIVIGGGFAGVKLIKKLSKQPLQIVLFDRNNYHTFQPLLYQVATAGLEPDSIADPLRKQLEPVSNFFFRMAEVYSIQYKEKYITTEIGDMSYDYLVIATGSKTNYFGNESIMSHAFPLKQIPQALDLRSHILQNFEEANITTDQSKLESMMNLTIVGGGPTGVEVAGALGELKTNILPSDYPELDFGKMNITLLEGTDRLLAAMSPFASKKALKYLKKFDVDVKLSTLVTSYDGKVAKLNNGGEIKTSTLIWAAGVQGNYPDGLEDDMIERGRIKVDAYNMIEGAENVYAIGDIALMKNDSSYPKGHPMLAPVAIQQGTNLAANIKRSLQGKTLKEFKYNDKGSMATIGRNKAVVDMGKIRLGGFFAWLIWMFVHLISIIGFRNRLIVFSNWVWNYFTYDKGTRLIIRKFIPRNKIKE